METGTHVRASPLGGRQGEGASLPSSAPLHSHGSTYGFSTRFPDTLLVNRTKVYQYAYPGAAEKWLKKAINWAARSRLKPFVRLSRTLRKHLDGVMAFLKTGFSNAVLESTCRHLRLLNARAYGYASAEAFIAMAHLHRGCIHIELPWDHPQIL